MCSLCHRRQAKTYRHSEKEIAVLVVLQTGRDTDTQIRTVPVVTSQTDRDIYSEKETAVLVVTSQTGRDTDTQRKRQLCWL